jgi:Ca2+-dependent lipid-binding protein
MDLIGNNDVFCQLSYGNQTITTTLSNLKDPIWNEVFPFVWSEGPLKLDVFDSDTLKKNDFIGSCNIPLPTKDAQSLSIDWFEINDASGKSRGKVHLIVEYVPTTVIDHLNDKFNKAAEEVRQQLIKKAVGFATESLVQSK